MFAPDADESPYHPPDHDPKAPLNPKTITHSATRLPSPPPETSDIPIPPSPSRSRIDAAISGRPYETKAPQETVAGFSYVEDLPTPSTSQVAPNLMTQGTLLATPRVLSGAPIEPPTPWRIQPPSRREEVGLKLSAKAARSIREKAALLSGKSRLGKPVSSSRGGMQPPSTVGLTPKKSMDNLTPAAKALLQRTTTGNATPARSGPSVGNAIDLQKVRWTPSPMTRK